MARRLLELLDRLSPGFPDPLPSEPFHTLSAWFAEARRGGRTPNPDAMVLATSSSAGAPSARVVLCRAMDAEHGSLTFYTNSTSRKGRDLAENPRAEAVFHWDEAGRQARVHGPVVRVPDEESDAYFASRPLLSRLGSWASEQSQELPSRAALAEELLGVMDRFGVGLADLALQRQGPNIPRPPQWGGYRLVGERVELWMMGAGRLHDRAAWTRTLGGGPPSAWKGARLNP